jgi:hypothetical protein
MARERAGEGIRGVKFTRESAAEVAELVRAARGGDRGQPPVRLPRAPLGGGSRLVRGTFSLPWSKGATATVTDAKVSGATYQAANYFAALNGTGTRNCVIAFIVDEWVLIATEC